MRHTNAKITLSTYAGLLGDDKVARLGERLAGLGIMKSTKVTEAGSHHGGHHHAG
jgi:hypothetical protein